jgi:hypothetical protein
VVVPSSGPPFVMARMMSKDCSDVSNVVMPRKNVVGPSNGSTTETNDRIGDAPSNEAASSRSRGTACNPAR